MRINRAFICLGWINFEDFLGFVVLDLLSIWIGSKEKQTQSSEFQYISIIPSNYSILFSCPLFYNIYTSPFMQLHEEKYSII